MQKIYRDKGKGKPLIINRDVQSKIQSFQNHLSEMLADDIHPQHKRIIRFILNNLEPYERNILIAYYEWDNEAAKMLGITTSVLGSWVRKINKKIKDRLCL